MADSMKKACCMLMTVLLAVAAKGATVVDGLKAQFRNGQVFMIWNDAPVPQGGTFNVYAASQPITASNLATATKIAHHVERQSARDWWRDPASFKKGAPSAEPIGFVIEGGGAPLNPAGGLFVHTPTAENVGLQFYAVTCVSPDGTEEKEIVAGRNATAVAVEQSVASTEAIWIGAGKEPESSATKGKSLRFNLHGRTGGGDSSANYQYLAFGGGKQGWREGLPFKFKLSVSDEAVVITPSNCFWAGRPVLESWDARDHVMAVENFWYGCNANIYDAALMRTGNTVNYSEEILLWMKDWAKRHLGIDEKRVYLQGGSMGGSGSIANAIQHADAYAAVCAIVPVVSYTKPGKGSARRLETVCGPITDKAPLTNEGIPLLNRMNGEEVVRKAEVDLPFLFIINGRKDASIPWENNPGFYRALNESRQGFVAFWNDGEHGTAEKLVPEDVKAWSGGGMLRCFALNQSFPAFSNCSTNKNPGSGDPGDGDIVGWMNRGLDWKDVEDAADHYAITILADYPGIEYPVSVDVTPRRVQQFKPSAGQKLKVKLPNGVEREIVVDKHGLFTVAGVAIGSKDGVRMTVSK